MKEFLDAPMSNAMTAPEIANFYAAANRLFQDTIATAVVLGAEFPGGEDRSAAQRSLVGICTALAKVQRELYNAQHSILAATIVRDRDRVCGLFNALVRDLNLVRQALGRDAIGLRSDFHQVGT